MNQAFRLFSLSRLAINFNLFNKWLKIWCKSATKQTLSIESTRLTKFEWVLRAELIQFSIKQKKINFNELKVWEKAFSSRIWFHIMVKGGRFNKIYRHVWNWHNIKLIHEQAINSTIIYYNIQSPIPHTTKPKNQEKNCFHILTVHIHSVLYSISFPYQNLQLYCCTSQQYPIKLLQSFMKGMMERELQK